MRHLQTSSLSLLLSKIRGTFPFSPRANNSTGFAFRILVCLHWQKVSCAPYIQLNSETSLSFHPALPDAFPGPTRPAPAHGRRMRREKGATRRARCWEDTAGALCVLGPLGLPGNSHRGVCALTGELAHREYPGRTRSAVLCGEGLSRSPEDVTGQNSPCLSRTEQEAPDPRQNLHVTRGGQ